MSWNQALDPKNETRRADSPKRPRKVSTTADASTTLLSRAKAWLAEVDPAIEGQGGSKVTFRAACELVGRFKLSRSQALGLLEHDYNPRCEPPWSRKELEHKVDDALDETQGEPVKEDRPRQNSERVHRDAKPENDYTEYTDSDAPDAPPAESGEQPQAKPKSRIELIEPAAIFAPLEEPDYVIDRVIRRGSLTQLVGYGGGFKTWTALDSVLSVGSGRHWLGRFPVKQGRAVYLDYENGQYEMRRRAHALAKAAGLANVDNIGFACMPPVYMSDPKFGAAVEPLADGCALLVVDTLKAANPGTDENDSNMRLGLDALRRVGEKTGCAFLVLVHSKKTSGTVMTIDPREAGRGSSAIYDAADTVFHATYVEGKPLHVQQTKARLGRPVDPFLVTITDTADGGVLVSASDVPETPVAAASDRFEESCQRVLDAVRDRPGSSAVVLREHLGMRNGTVRAALERLSADGAVRNTGTKSDPRWFPILAAASNDD